jgi:catechol 2,3-dioxygenase-like lactoylglutathione lyase family enzyme
MAIEGLDHINIRSTDKEATAAFFVDVLGMTRSDVFPSWINDAAGRPIVHLGDAHLTYPTDEWRPFRAATDSGSIHHVALSCSGYEGVRDSLSTHGYAYRENHVPQVNLRQIFVVEPGGVLLELNFRGD